MSLTGEMTGSRASHSMKAVERLLLICFLLFSSGAGDVCGPTFSVGLTIQMAVISKSSTKNPYALRWFILHIDASLRAWGPWRWWGWGRPQTCSGAQGSLQQLAKRRLRDLVERLWGGGSSAESSSIASHEDLGGGSQQADAACNPMWTGLLFSHRAVSVTVLLATAALAFLAFWDIRLVFELILWPWRGCMAITNWIYHSLDERCMSQRRQVAEVALRNAMKSGDLDALSLALEEAETARVDVPVKRRAAAQLRDLRRKLSRVQKRLRSGREPRRASSSPHGSSRSRSASPPPQDKGPEDHSATGSASELHGGAQQAGWQGPKDGSAPSQNGIRDEAQLRPAASEKGQSPASSRQISSSFSLQSSLSEPVPGQLSSGQDGPAVPNASGRGRGSLAASSEVELQRDSASQVELAARAVEAREMEKERLRQEKENSRKERAQARLMQQQQQQQQAPAVCEASQEKAPSLLPSLGTPRGILKGASFFGNGRHQAAPNGTAPEPRTHYRAPRKAVPISLVSDSTTPRGGKRGGPSTLCVPRNQAHINGEGGPCAKAGTSKAAGGTLAGKSLEAGLSWSPSSAPTTPSGKGDGVPSLPFAQGLQAARALNGFGDALPAFVQPPPPPPKTWAQAARGKIQGERPVSADSRPSTAPEHAVQGARSGSLNGLFQSPAASPAPPAHAPSFVGSSLYSSEGFRFPNGVSQASAGSLSPFPGMTANRMAPISRPPALSQMGSWSGGDEALGSLGLPAFSSGATMMSMPQAAPSAYPGLQGLWGPVTQPPLTGSSPPGWTPWRMMPPASNCDMLVAPSASPRDPLTGNGVKGELSEESSAPSGSRFSTLSASSSLETCT